MINIEPIIHTPSCDITPIKRGIQLRCTYPAINCPLVEMSNWGFFKYKFHIRPDPTWFGMDITAPDTMDGQIGLHMYGFASNICHTCIARRMQNAL